VGSVALESTTALAQVGDPAASEAPPFVSAASGKGITVTAPDDSFSMTLRGRIQIRETVTIADDEAKNEVNVRTMRIHMLGHVLSPDIRYAVQLAFGTVDFEPGNPSPIFDAWLDFQHIRDAKLKVGQYFVPFDRARTNRESNLQLVDRQQMVTELNLDRDVGVTLHSEDFLGLEVLNYSLGVFGGNGRNRTGSQEMGYLYMGRLGVRPMGPFDDDTEGDLKLSETPRLSVGVAGGYNQNTDRNRSTIGATYQLGTVDYIHAAADAVFKFQGLSLLLEGLYRTSPEDTLVGEIDGETVTEYTRSGWGYLAQFGYMLTDQIEVAGRYDELYAFDGTDPALVDLVDTQGRETGLGLNYYLNGHSFKFQADHAMRFRDDLAAATHFARLQVDASF
jgi:hypothetical protein